MVFDLLGQRDRDKEKYGNRVPPEQKVVEDWPVLSYGGTPRIDLDKWTFRLFEAVEEEVAFTWREFVSLPQVTIESDIHCVTAWSKMDNLWDGVAFKELVKYVRLKPEANAAMAHSFGGYTTNLLLEDLRPDKVLLAHRHNGQELAPEHGGPLRLVVPHLYFWKSAKWIRGLEFMADDRPGFWEMYGYHMRGEPWKQERYG